MKNTNSLYRLIPTNLHAAKDRFPAHDGYHGDGFKNLISYLECSSTNYGCSIICNGGKIISSKSNHNHYRLFICTHGSGYCGDVLNRQSTVYREFHILMTEAIIDCRVNLHQEDQNAKKEQNFPYSFQIFFIQMVIFL